MNLVNENGGSHMEKKVRNVHLIGLGAIGGAYAGRIVEKYPESLQVIVDSQRRERYGRDGVTINGEKVDFTYAVPGEHDVKSDLIIIAVKQHHLALAIEEIRSFVGPDTIILSLLNGIVSEEVLGREFGPEKMLYSFCVGTDAVRKGTDIHYTNMGKIVMGDKDDPGSAKLAAVKEFFDISGVPYSVPEDIMRELWWKFMLNVGINQVSAVLKAPYGAFTREGEARELMISASREVIAIAGKAGVNLTENDIQDYLKVIATLSPEGKTSMCQDVEAGRKTEVEIFSGTVIELGNKYGVPTPVNNVLFRLLRAIEQLAVAAFRPVLRV
ncbi:MAG TPA: ketopantoate reductase family protein [Clostridia bacterium]|nr:ketopantoate reductase family protein [Clostridia bacterium]